MRTVTSVRIDQIGGNKLTKKERSLTSRMKTKMQLKLIGTASECRISTSFAVKKRLHIWIFNPSHCQQLCSPINFYVNRRCQKWYNFGHSVSFNNTLKAEIMLYTQYTNNAPLNPMMLWLCNLPKERGTSVRKWITQDIKCEVRE